MGGRSRQIGRRHDPPVEILVSFIVAGTVVFTGLKVVLGDTVTAGTITSIFINTAFVAIVWVVLYRYSRPLRRWLTYHRRSLIRRALPQRSRRARSTLRWTDTIAAWTPRLLGLFAVALLIGASVGTGVTGWDTTANRFLGQEAGNTSDAIADDRRDADGDGLPDGWETAGETPADTQLVDASPEKKDLFVHVVRTEGIDPLTEAEREELRRVWAEMPVDNPSGETGIQIHITGTKIDDRVMSSGSEGDFERLQESYFTELSPTNCVYHTVFLTDIDSYRTAGRAESPGYFAIVDGKRGPGGRWYRVNTITHELLHNIVVIDGDDGHTTSGWLSHSGDRQLSSFTAERLDSGFSHPSSYDGCDVPDFDD